MMSFWGSFNTVFMKQFRNRQKAKKADECQPFYKNEIVKD
jgi:hypothetical protein